MMVRATITQTSTFVNRRLNDLDQSLLKQVVPVLILCGSGLLAAGYLLEHSSRLSTFANLPSLFILVPVLLGLKGNIEMTLASRLGSAWHLGYLSKGGGRRRLLMANFSLVQLQAISVGMLASILAILHSLLIGDGVTSLIIWKLLASGVVTASIAASLLFVFTSLLVLTANRVNLNPDNVSGPMVASVGDLVALGLLVSVAYTVSGTEELLKLIVPTSFIILSLPLWFWLASRSPSTIKARGEGWKPILIAMILGGIAGIFLEFGVQVAASALLLIPLLNGLGGNIAGIHGSRACSNLHEGCKEDTISTTRSLIVTVVPIQTLFLGIAWIVTKATGITPPPLWMVVVFLPAALIQVLVLLPTAAWLAERSWQRGRDPDNHVLPYLTALADLLGTSFLILPALMISIM